VGAGSTVAAIVPGSRQWWRVELAAVGRPRTQGAVRVVRAAAYRRNRSENPTVHDYLPSMTW